MLTIALIAAFAALASAEVKYTCGDFTELADGPGYGATGSVELFETADGVKVVGTDLHVTKDAAAYDSTYVAHVHALSCADGAGGHWEINSTVTEVIESNELWVGPQTQAGDAVWGNTAEQNEFKSGTFVGDVPLSFVIHENVNDTSPKRVCCDLMAAVTTMTTTGTSDAANNTTAPATTVAADESCADAADPVACCDALNNLEQADGEEFNEDLDNCNMCVKNAGCEFYRNIGGSVAEVKTECVPPGTDTSVGLTQVTDVEECELTEKLCDDLECEECLAKEACVWCDTGATIGISTGSCTDTSCTSGVDPSTECSSASIASVAALAVAAAAALKL